MAATLYDRVAARAFPVSVVTQEQTGAGALESQGLPLSPQDLSESDPGKYVTLPGYTGDDGLPAPEVLIIDGAFGLPGGLNEDHTPQTHAAPTPGWTGSYAPSQDLYDLHESSMLIHGEDFGALAPRMTSPASIAEPTLDIENINSPGENELQAVSGQLAAMGGYDATQGYGGGGDGPGGTNSYGFSDVRRTYIRATDPQPNGYVDPAERPFIVPQASGSFEQTDAVVGEPGAGSYWAGGDIAYNDPSPYTPPPDPATLSSPLPSAPISAGWW
ncbi:MAG TPA: hypothetical protein VGG75_05665 [Trebonia sp.]|jgi:hypothetical protein